ncbi:transcriptional regulator, partial [Clostridioides difficile]
MILIKNTKIKLIKVLGGMEMKEENFINVEYEDKRFSINSKEV